MDKGSTVEERLSASANERVNDPGSLRPPTSSTGLVEEDIAANGLSLPEPNICVNSPATLPRGGLEMLGKTSGTSADRSPSNGPWKNFVKSLALPVSMLRAASTLFGLSFTSRISALMLGRNSAVNPPRSGNAPSTGPNEGPRLPAFGAAESAGL